MPSAERYSNPELAGALRYGVRHNTVETNCSEHQRDDRKQCYYEQAEAAGCNRFIKHLSQVENGPCRAR